MAGEVRAESPAPEAAPPLPVHEKRAGSEEEEERPEPKRRRACVAALDSVPCAVPTDGEGDGDGDEHRDGAAFSFQHARGGFMALETTPKFGSFNPPAAAEQVATEPKSAPPAGEDSPQVVEEEEEASPSDRRGGEDKDGNSQLLVLGLGVQGQT